MAFLVEEHLTSWRRKGEEKKLERVSLAIGLELESKNRREMPTFLLPLIPTLHSKDLPNSVPRTERKKDVEQQTRRSARRPRIHPPLNQAL